jgi:hypothetical protein
MNCFTYNELVISRRGDARGTAAGATGTTYNANTNDVTYWLTKIYISDTRDTRIQQIHQF